MEEIKHIPQTMKLNDIAEIFRVHPRTILRHIKHDDKAYWVKGYNPDIYTSILIETMSVEPHVLVRIINGTDELLTPTEASKFLQIAHRTFSFRKYGAAIRAAKTVRYSSIDIANEHIDKYLKM